MHEDTRCMHALRALHCMACMPCANTCACHAAAGASLQDAEATFKMDLVAVCRPKAGLDTMYLQPEQVRRRSNWEGGCVSRKWGGAKDSYTKGQGERGRGSRR